MNICTAWPSSLRAHWPVLRAGLQQVSLLQQAHFTVSCVAASSKLQQDVDPSSLPRIALVGRANVGKSTMFNRLVGRRQALVHDTPGSHVTRDYREGVGSISDLRFLAVDTPGLDGLHQSGDSIQARSAAQVKQARCHATRHRCCAAHAAHRTPSHLNPCAHRSAAL